MTSKDKKQGIEAYSKALIPYSVRVRSVIKQPEQVKRERLEKVSLLTINRILFNLRQ